MVGHQTVSIDSVLFWLPWSWDPSRSYCSFWEITSQPVTQLSVSTSLAGQRIEFLLDTVHFVYTLGLKKYTQHKFYSVFATVLFNFVCCLHVCLSGSNIEVDFDPIPPNRLFLDVAHKFIMDDNTIFMHCQGHSSPATRAARAGIARPGPYKNGWKQAD